MKSLSQTLNPTSGTLTGRGEKQTLWEGGCVKTRGRDQRGRQLWAKNSQDSLPPAEATRESGNWLLLRPSRGDQPCQHLDFGLLASSTVLDSISVVLNHSVCSALFSSPRKELSRVSQLRHCWHLGGTRSLLGGGAAALCRLSDSTSLSPLNASSTTMAWRVRMSQNIANISWEGGARGANLPWVRTMACLLTRLSIRPFIHSCIHLYLIIFYNIYMEMSMDQVISLGSWECNGNNSLYVHEAYSGVQSLSK